MLVFGGCVSGVYIYIKIRYGLFLFFYKNIDISCDLY